MGGSGGTRPLAKRGAALHLEPLPCCVQDHLSVDEPRGASRVGSGAPVPSPAASSCGLAGSVQPADPGGVTETMTKSVPPIVTIHKHYHFILYLMVQKRRFLHHSATVHHSATGSIPPLER